MFKTITLIALATFAFSAEADAKKPSVAEEAYTKAVEVNCKDVYKNYDVYLKSLEVANQKVIKSLEGVKVDLNDTKKFVKLGIAERADAIKEIDGKIAELKKGALGEAIVARSSGSGSDLLGEGVDVGIKKMIVGKWETSQGNIYVFDNSIVTYNNSLKGEWKVLASKIKITWQSGKEGFWIYDDVKKNFAPENGDYTITRIR